MAVPSYTTDLIDIDLGEAGGKTWAEPTATGWTYGAAPSVDTENFIQGSGSISKAFNAVGVGGMMVNNTAGITLPTDGAYFKFSGSSIYACTLKNGTETPVISNLWNTSTTLPVLTNVNSYEIYYTNAKVYFVIAGVLMHTASFPASTWSANLNLGVRMENTNSGSAAAQNILEARVATVYRLGQEQTAPIYKHLTGATTMVLKYAPGTLHKIIVNTAGTLCTIYDGASAAGNVIGILDTNKTSGTIGSIAYDVPFFTGLTFVTTGATTDLTIVYE